MADDKENGSGWRQGILDSVGRPVLGASVLFYVTVQTLTQFGILPQAAPVKTAPIYRGHEVQVIDKIDDLHRWHNRHRPDGSFVWDVPEDLTRALREVAESQNDLADALDAQQEILREAILRLRLRQGSSATSSSSAEPPA